MLIERHKAQPTLRGVIAPTFKPAPELPWLRLSPTAAGFKVVAEDGTLVRRRRKLSRDVIICFRTARQHRAADRAHQRAVRRTIDRGDLDLLLAPPSDLPFVRRFAVVLTLLLAAVIGWLVLQHLGGLLSTPAPYRWIAWLTLGAMIAVAVLFPAAYYAIFRKMTDTNIRRVRLTAHGLEAEFRDGRATRQLWRDLRSITGRWRLEFADGTQVRIVPGGLSNAVLSQIRDRYDPGATARERQGHWLMGLRLFVYFQLGGIAAAALARSGIGPPGRSPLVAYAFVGLLFPLALTISALAQFYLQPGRRTSPRPRRPGAHHARTRIART